MSRRPLCFNLPIHLRLLDSCCSGSCHLTELGLSLSARSERAVSWHPGVASVDAPTAPTPATKTFASFDKMLDDNELPVLVDFHAHWWVFLASVGWRESSCTRQHFPSVDDKRRTSAFGW